MLGTFAKGCIVLGTPTTKRLPYSAITGSSTNVGTCCADLPIFHIRIAGKKILAS